MFHGESAIKMDSKGRMAMPTSCREDLIARCGGKLVVTVNNIREDCLWLYPMDEWEVAAAKVNALSSFNKQHQQLKRFFIGSAKTCEMDPNTGRILIPARLREFARLEKDVSLVGLVNKFEIWDGRRWDNDLNSWRDGDADLDNISGDMEAMQL